MNSISWEPKGKRIAKIVSDMQLQAKHVLFIDDNRMNRDEAVYYCPGLIAVSPDCIPELMQFAAKLPLADPDHRRLDRYRILESKICEKAVAVSNDAFLRASDIRVSFHAECEPELDRITELVARTNQLNFTKNRMQRAEIAELIADINAKSAYVRVRDRFGDYGIVGFYTLKDAELVHFVFSCSILGMGIEQFTYKYLGSPVLAVQGEVASSLAECSVRIDHVTVDDAEHHGVVTDKTPHDARGEFRRVLLKGPCDISSIIPLLDNRSEGRLELQVELNHPDSRGVMITAQNHTTHIAQALSISNHQIEELLRWAPFLNFDAFETVMFNGFDVVVLSTLTDSHQGVYELKTDPRLKVTFSSFNFDLTDPGHWDGFISGVYPNQGFPFTREVLVEFAEHFEFIGPVSPDLLVVNLARIREQLDDSTLLLLLLGCEVSPLEVEAEYWGRAERHREVNREIEIFAASHTNVRLINFTDLINGPEDLPRDINHFSRETYFEIASRISLVINEFFGEDLTGTVSHFQWLRGAIARRFGRRFGTLFPHRNRLGGELV